MLVLSRKHRESVIVGGGGGFQGLLLVTVLDVKGGKVKLGFKGDAGIPIHRLEIWERKRAAGEMDSFAADSDVLWSV